MKTRSVSALLVSLVGIGCGDPGASAPCMGRGPGDVVITELLADPLGADTGSEWVELVNAVSAAIELRGTTLYVRDSSGSTKSHVLRAGTVAPGEYFVLGDVRTGPNPGWIDYSYSSDVGALPQTAAAVGLKCGTLTLDEVSYGRPPAVGRSRMLSGGLAPDAALNDDDAAWCSAPTGARYADAGNAGTPGEPNPPCPVADGGGADGGAVPDAGDATSCVDPDGGMRPISPPAAGDVVITEFMADPSAVPDTSGEWIELLVKAPADLNGLAIGNEGSTAVLASPACLWVPGPTWVIVARSADAAQNGGLPPVAGTFGFTLANSGTRAIVVSRAGVELDRLAYSSSTAGASTQLDGSKVDPADNDVAANLCPTPATARYGGDADAGALGDRGTPGRPNVPCP